MKVVWKYLDKRAAAIAALKDFSSMEFIIKNTDDDIKVAYAKMTSVCGFRYDGMPHAKNPHAQEDNIIRGIEEIDVLKERYRQALEYMQWFVPAWDALSDDERYVLDAFYSEDNTYGAAAADDVSEYFNIERASAYRKKNRAIDKLTVLLFGKA